MVWRKNDLFCDKSYCSETVSHRLHSKPVQHLHLVLNEEKWLILKLKNFSLESFI